jgi:hypothetical protein
MDQMYKIFEDGTMYRLVCYEADGLIAYEDSYRDCADAEVDGMEWAESGIMPGGDPSDCYYEDDGQPDEAQEWADFDPDC